MTYIITLAGKDSIYMASDSRLEYFNEKEINGEKYKEIVAFADCIKKTFFIENLKIGIQFSGIGFLPDKEEKYPLSYFIKKLEDKNSSSVDESFELVFNFFKDLSIEGDTGQYVKGIMSAIDKGDKKVCLFNTFDNDFRVEKLEPAQYVENEKIGGSFSLSKDKIIQEIKKRIAQKSREKWWTIGGKITLLEINQESHSFLLESDDFSQSQKELIRCFRGDLNKINGRILTYSKLVKYELPTFDKRG